MTESKPPADAAADDVTARVLAAAKSLHDGFEDTYAAAAAKVKKEVEGPVKVIDTGDDIPITMQLSVWDTKMGPQPAMLVGSAAQLATISPSEQDDTTRLMDFMEPGATCDLSKGGRNRLLHKFTIADPGARGGDSWFSLAIYYTPAVDVPKEVIEELLVEMARSWHDDASLAAEALAIRDAYNPATSRWREYLQEIRLSTWALVQKASELHPPPIPGMTDAETAAIFKGQASPAGRDVEVPAPGPAPAPRKKRARSRPEAEIAAFFSKLARATLDAKERAKQAFEARVAARKQLVVPPTSDVVAGAAAFPCNESPPATVAVSPAAPLVPATPATPAGPIAGDVPAPVQARGGEGASLRDPGPEIDPLDALDALEARGNGTPVPIQITPARPASPAPSPAPVTPALAKARLVPVEAALVEVLGKLQRSGYSLKVDKETGEATACKLVELDPGKGGLLGLFLSFHARFLPHAVLHEIDGRFYAGDDRVATTPHRPSIRAAIAAHLHGVQDIVYKGMSIGKVYKERPFKPVIIPLVLVRSCIEGSSGPVPFKWVEPNPPDGIEHGHLVVAAPAIDRAEAFVMNCVRVLGPRMVAAEAAHVTSTGADIATTSRAAILMTAAVLGLCVLGALASAHWLPIPATVAILQYWYVLAAALVIVLGAGINTCKKLDQRVHRAIDARLQDVTSRTPLLAKPAWELLVDAARRIGKEDFGEFKAAFCQELDPLAVDETVEVVWQQDASRAVPAPRASIDALGALATAAAKPKAPAKAKAKAKATPAATAAPGLRVTGAPRPSRREQARDDDILNEAGDGEAEAEAGDGETSTGGDAVEDLAFDPLATLKGR